VEKLKHYSQAHPGRRKKKLLKIRISFVTLAFKRPVVGCFFFASFIVIL